MTRATFSVLFYIKKTKVLKDGTLPVYARITVNGQRAEFGLQKSIESSQWDHHKGCAQGFSKSAKELNSYLDYVKTNLHLHKRDMEEYGKEITAYDLKNLHLGISEENKTVLEIFKEHNEKCAGLVNKDFSFGTVQRYNTCYNHIADFIKQKYKKNDMPMNAVTPMFISDFEYYLKTKHNCNHNTATKYIKNFKKIVRIALANNWMKSDPFKNIKFHLDDVDMDFLSEDELSIMIKKEFVIERLQQVKDIYLFCCFKGLAFIDVKSLAYSYIEEKDGKLWIKKRRQKTKNWCHIPLLPPAVVLMNKYKNHPVCQRSACVLPVITNQRMNSYLKEIADVCGINKNLTTHTARHTFATTVTLANQVSMEVVSKMLGHAGVNMNMTRKYARVGEVLINRDMQKIFGKSNNVMVQWKHCACY